MNKEQLKQMVLETIDKNKAHYIALGKEIYKNPELGFKEYNTAKIVKSTFTDLHIPFESELAITGIKGKLTGKSHKANVAVIGELDAVVCPLHPNADLQTGAAHSCAHFAQTTHLMMIADAFSKSGVMEHLDGDLSLVSVPAEEYVELEFRERLKEDGKIEFFGGKQEFIRLGVFDDIDMSIMVHGATEDDTTIEIGQDAAGFVGKIIKFKGKEAHAGASPHDGINALNAACLGLMAINAQRETFQEKDAIRVHPIITKGGDLVNIVPADVRMETYVRGMNIPAVMEASKKVNRALKGAAYSIGGEVEINEIPGYLPVLQDKNLGEVLRANAEALVGKEHVKNAKPIQASSDAGDLSAIMPMVQLSASGFKGGFHSRDFDILDEDMAFVVPAKTMAMSIIDLLYDGAKTALDVKENYTPSYKSKEEYLSFWRNFLD